ncbi:MAG: endolytic transglycosylase MltG [Oscillospiraceae bacterium]|nr:endolytic transglycosylase MltG [Oscillospiraceae bacterium]
MKKTRKNKAKWRAFRALTPYIVIVSLGIAMLFAAWLIPTVNEVLALARPDREVIIEIPEESSRADVAKILKKNDVIEHTAVFKTFALLTKREAEFPAGRYKVNSNMDYRAMLRRLTSKKAALNTVMVTIPEGYEVSQIVKLLEDKGVCEEKSLLEAIANSDFDYAFLDGVPLGKTNRLEGYLFPDTYEFYKGDSAERVIKRFLDNFEVKYNSEMSARARELGFTTHELITLASIVEREATAKDRANIASVFHNRLKDSSYPYLESCATVQYVLGERKKVISIADTKIDNKYNTYKYKGLPPGPIANPGLDAINATLYPNNTDYLFFALQEDGTHKFSKTYEEHLKTPKINP